MEIPAMAVRTAAAAVIWVRAKAVVVMLLLTPLLAKVYGAT
jgi:hypothetical protein